MNKPRGVRWLEEETGQTLDRSPAPTAPGTHLSVRLPGPMLAQLEQLAASRGESVSQVARRLIADGIARTEVPERDALDSAIAALEKIRSRLGSSVA